MIIGEITNVIKDIRKVIMKKMNGNTTNVSDDNITSENDIDISNMLMDSIKMIL